MIYILPTFIKLSTLTIDNPICNIFTEESMINAPDHHCSTWELLKNINPIPLRFIFDLLETTKMIQRPKRKWFILGFSRKRGYLINWFNLEKNHSAAALFSARYCSGEKNEGSKRCGKKWENIEQDSALLDPFTVSQTNHLTNRWNWRWRQYKWSSPFPPLVSPHLQPPLYYDQQKKNSFSKKTLFTLFFFI